MEGEKPFLFFSLSLSISQQKVLTYPCLLIYLSYDGQVRLFDKRNPLKPLTSFDVGGGIWRLKWHPSNPQRLLIAAMHNGFSVIDFKGLVTTTNVGEGGNLEPGEGELVKRFEGHESLAYGVDWNQGNAEKTEDGEDLVASCSFYDHALHVWSV